MNNKHLQLIIPLLFIVLTASSQPIENSVFHSHQGTNSHWLTYLDNHRALYRIITDEAFELLEQRADEVANLQTVSEWEKYQAEIKPVLCEPLSKFSKTPLNAKITGTLERETFTVEKVLFESHPGFYVTAALFLPKERQNPAPAVIYSCGHTDLGFRSETYQHVIINLVQKGFIVLAFDPMGQGERFLYPGSDPRTSRLGGPTREHSYAGIQTLMTGSSLSEYFIWDGIRVIDYLETRPEVDMKRIAITGRSGGGTQTALIAACDDRIYAAAPENYITNFKRLLQAIGPQDAEQNPYHAIAKGFDHPDFLHIRAPKPTLMITTTNDFFNIQGARESYTEGIKSYSAFGKPENLQMVEDFGNHQSTPKNREALYAFFQKHLNLPGDPDDYDVEPFSFDELLVTPTGQVQTSYTGESIFSLNRKYFKKNNTTVRNLSTQAIKNAGINPERKLTATVYTGKQIMNGMAVEKYFIENDRNDFVLPLYLIKKEGGNYGNLVLWLHSHGKEQLLGASLLKELTEAGYAVISADLPGTGELHDPEFSGDGEIEGITFNYMFGANLIGKSVAGIQAEALDLVIQSIEQDHRFNNTNLTALIQGNAAYPFLYYAAYHNQFDKAAFYDFPSPVQSLINEEYFSPAAAFPVVPGSLQYYDTPDLLKSLSGSGTKVITQRGTDSTLGADKSFNTRLIEFIKK